MGQRLANCETGSLGMCYVARVARVRTFPGWITRKAYWLAAALPLLMPLGWSLREIPGMGVAFAWVSLIVLYLVLPALDFMIGRDRHNPESHENPVAIDWRVPVAAAGAYLAVLFWSLHTWAAHPDVFNIWSTLGWTLSLADMGGGVAINVAHELIHRKDRGARALGGVLLSCVWYPGFKLEHPFWHHIHVATPADPASAPLGSSVYRQVPRALVMNSTRGWRLARDMARKKGRAYPWLANEMNSWYVLSLALTVGIGVWLGWGAMAIFVAHGLGAAALLEHINYVEHYGLRRAKTDSGRYERPRARHSWDSDFWLSNALLLQLPRHADHHANPTRPFSALQTSVAAPLLPFGYSTAVLVSMIPPLWRALIHPRVPGIPTA